MNNYTSKPVSLAQREEGLGESDRVLYISLCFQWLLEDKEGVCADRSAVQQYSVQFVEGESRIKCSHHNKNKCISKVN